MKESNLETQRILILGLGREGFSTYTHLRRVFPTTHLALADQTPFENLPPEIQALAENDHHVTFFTGEAYLSHLSEVDVIFKSPGIIPTLPEIRTAQANGVHITSNTALFFDLCPGKIIGITGTKGKSTTTSLIHEVLRHGGFDVRLLGNIGIAPLSMLDRAESTTLFVAELSSYQLNDLQKSPHIAVLQNIVPEHLHYHGTFEAYIEAKANIMHYQTPNDYAIYDTDFPLPTQIAQASHATKIGFGFEKKPETRCYLEGDWLVYGAGEKVIAVQDIPLRGHFNLINVMPSIIIGRHFGLSVETIAEAIRGFKPLAHRLEYVCTVRGVDFYNDSLSTVPEAAIAAMESFPDRPILLIAGGFDRGLDFSSLAQKLIETNVRGLILFPTTGEKIWQALIALNPSTLPPHFHVTGMHAAMEHIAEIMQAGDVVLLSPASPSFTTFVDYRDRGDQFKAEAMTLFTKNP